MECERQEQLQGRFGVPSRISLKDFMDLGLTSPLLVTLSWLELSLILTEVLCLPPRQIWRLLYTANILESWFDFFSGPKTSFGH